MVLGTKRNPNWREMCVVNAVKVRCWGWVGGGVGRREGSLVSFNERGGGRCRGGRVMVVECGGT